MVKIKTPEEIETLERLLDQLQVENEGASDALRTNGEPMNSAARQRLLEHDRKAAEIVGQIKEILGE